jgi:hypothetical protein
MRQSHNVERWSQFHILRNLLATLAIALAWMVAVAASY